MFRQANERSHVAARKVRPLSVGMDSAKATALAQNYQALQKLGIGLDSRHVTQMVNYFGMDAATPNITAQSVSAPVQFLQSWLPGFVETVTAARKIDMLVGVTTQGEWYDEEVVQGVMEHTGESRVYGDYNDIPYASWNATFERRTIVRFEDGMRVGALEEARAGAMQINSAASKRTAASTNLDIRRNAVGFYGFNDGNNRTYGFLNDPELPAYVNLPNGAGGDSTFASKTFLEITLDLRAAAQQLRTQSQEKIDPSSDAITLAIATDAREFLTVTSDYGNSVNDWIRENYPNWRIESAPELNEANGGESVFYMYAESVSDSGTDDQRTMVQIVPSRFQTIGVNNEAKFFEEVYANATAGIMVKRPYAVVRFSGC